MEEVKPVNADYILFDTYYYNIRAIVLLTEA
jgi:hypothetical protein